MAQWMYLTLKPYANKIAICDPKVNKWIHADEKKNDKVDSRKLADLYRMGCISEVYHTDVEDLSLLRRLVVHYDKLVQNSIRAKNRIKALYKYYGLFVKGTSVYNPDKREEYLSAIKFKEIRQLMNNYYQQIDLYQPQKDQIEKMLQTVSKKYPVLKKIKTVPGIGLIRGTTIFAIIVTPERFSTKSKLNKYCGLAVVEKGSAGEVYYSYASKSGNHLLKRVIMDAATTCISISKNNYFLNHYKELISMGLSEKEAKRTIAREILHVVMGVWKNNECAEKRLC